MLIFVAIRLWDPVCVVVVVVVVVVGVVVVVVVVGVGVTSFYNAFLQPFAKQQSRPTTTTTTTTTTTSKWFAAEEVVMQSKNPKVSCINFMYHQDPKEKGSIEIN